MDATIKGLTLSHNETNRFIVLDPADGHCPILIFEGLRGPLREVSSVVDEDRTTSDFGIEMLRLSKFFNEGALGTRMFRVPVRENEEYGNMVLRMLKEFANTVSGPDRAFALKLFDELGG